VNLALPCALAIFLGCSAAHADIYRAVDENGKVTFTNIKVPGRTYEVMIREPAARPTPPEAGGTADRAAMRGYPVRTRALYASHIEAAARAAGVDAALIHAVISAESGYNAGARSPKGAVGLMQLMPGTALRYSVSNRLDPAQNILGGARYLRDLQQMFGNDLRLVLAAYNAGEKAVMKYGNRIPPYPETIAYVPKVLRFYSRYRTGI
jgi:soluble lytic murein transglycosylase-like protein